MALPHMHMRLFVALQPIMLLLLLPLCTCDVAAAADGTLVRRFEAFSNGEQPQSDS